LTSRLTAFRATATALLLLGLGLSWARAMEDSPPEPGVDPVVQLRPSHTQTQDARILVAAARNVVNLVVASARTIAAGDAAEAGPLLAEASRLLEQIQASQGQTARIGPAQVTARVIPVSARVAVTPEAEADATVTARIQALEPLMLAGEQELVVTGLQQLGTALTYEYVGMPVQSTSEGVDLASAALAADQPDAAAEALNAVIRGLDSREVNIDPAADPGPSTPDVAPGGRP